MNMPGERNEKGNYGYKALIISSRILVRVLVVVFFVVLVIFICKKAHSLGYEVTSYKPADEKTAQEIPFAITIDMTIEDVGNRLIENGIINESLDAFLIQERLSDYHDKFLPGVYTLNDGMTIEQILEEISTPSEEAAEQ